MSPQTAAVLAVLIEAPDQAHYGLAIARCAGLNTRALHPWLARPRSAGWLSSSWEDPADHEDQGRPRRRYYRLTKDGEVAARRAVAVANSSTGVAGLRPRTAQ